MKINIKNLTIFMLVCLLILVSVLYVQMRTEYLLLLNNTKYLVDQNHLYMNKYESCLSLQVIEVNRKLTFYRDYAVKLRKYYIQTKGYAKGGLK